MIRIAVISRSLVLSVATSITLTVTSAGCRPVEPAASLPVILPDLSALAEPVQRQLQQRFDELVEQQARPSTTPAELAEGYGDLGRLLLAAELGTAAATSFRYAETLAPEDSRWPYLLGHALRFVDDRAGALAAFERSAAIDRANLTTLVWLAETHLDGAQAAEAEALFLEAASLASGSAAARFGAGRAALARQAYADAVRYFEEALALEPRASAVHYPLAMAYRALGDGAQVETHLRQRGDVWPTLSDPLLEQQSGLLESVTAFELRGAEAMGAGDWDSAARAFRAGLELEPDDPALRHRLGTALYAAGDATGAVSEFEEAIRRSPDHAPAHVSLGTVLSVQGDYDAAIEHLTTALDVDPNSVEGRFGLAEVLRVSGRPEDALHEYAQVIRLDPGIVQAWVGRGAALIALGRYQEARQSLVEARRVHPNHPQLAELETMLPAT